MQKRGMRYAAGLLVTGLLIGLTAPAARAAGISVPWFGNVSVSTPSSSDPFTLMRSYVPFWSYVEGLPWVAYTEWRVSLTAVPSIYTARSATPLPTLPAQPSFATAVARVVRAVRPAPAPATESDTAVEFTAPAPEPTAPAPEPTAPAPQTPAPDSQSPAPTSPPAAAGLTDDERTLIALVNAERSKEGLTSLQVDMRLVATARAKSADMAANGYFDHNSPTLGSPFEQMKAAGITYRTAGENIAGNQSVTAAHAALMNSPGHRANILKPEFTKIGIGIVSGGRYGLMVTQQFIGE